MEAVTYVVYFFFFFFNDTATTEIYTLSLHDALPICSTPTRSRRAQWFWALERAGADEHAAGLRLSDRAIRDRPVTLGDCSPNRLGGARDGLARAARSRPALAYLGECRRSGDCVERRVARRDHHSGRAGQERWRRCFHRNLPRSRHLARLTGDSADCQPQSTDTGFPGGVDAGRASGSCRRE